MRKLKNMDVLNQYVVIVVLGICLCVGFILKNLVPCEQVNRFIPLIVGGLGILLNVWVCDGAISPEILLGGLVSGLASTGMYEAFRNFLKEN